MPQLQSEATVCLFCGGIHEFSNNGLDLEPIVCGLCHACWRYCQHLPNCNWPEKERHVVENNAVNVKTVVESLATTSLQQAFEAWIVSSDLVKVEVLPEKAWTEFELFAKEQLTAVDPVKKYLQISFGVDKVNNITLLDASKLYTNQDGVFVLVEGKKRNRIGKDVAVMG